MWDVEMTPNEAEAWGRRGTIRDCQALLRLLSCLDAAGRCKTQEAVALLDSQTVDFLPPQEDSPAASVSAPARDPSLDLELVAGDSLAWAADLLQTYAYMTAENKAKVFFTLITAVADRRMREYDAAADGWEDVDSWLNALAADACPWSTSGMELLSRLSCCSLDWFGDCFQGESIQFAIQPSEFEIDTGYDLFSTYASEWERARYPAGLPEPYDGLGVTVSKREFMTWEDGEDVFDKEAWEAEMDHRAALEMAEIPASWRARLVDALVTGRRPEARMREGDGGS